LPELRTTILVTQHCGGGGAGGGIGSGFGQQ